MSDLVNKRVHVLLYVRFLSSLFINHETKLSAVAFLSSEVIKQIGKIRSELEYIIFGSQLLLRY